MALGSRGIPKATRRVNRTIARSLIVNADDFGQSSGINRGIITAHKYGIVTSASLMVRWPAAAEAADYARKNPELSLGLHLDLGEWVYQGGEWIRAYTVVADDEPTAVSDEVAQQLAWFRRLVGREPTHLDSHQHVHRQDPVRSIVRRVARDLRVPLRDCSRKVRYCGDFYGQTDEGAPFPSGISVENLLRILANLQCGVTELGCHPGLGDDLASVYRHERAREVRVLCDARVRAALDEQRIELRSFGPPR